jgi:Zn2+/Cd2+-exporting ATPase
MQRPLTADPSMILTVLTVTGMLVALAGIWPLEGEIAAYSSFVGLTVVYLAGGLPTTWRALQALWQEHILDIDLLMVVAAVAAAAVGAPFEGAVLLTCSASRPRWKNRPSAAPGVLSNP